MDAHSDLPVVLSECGGIALSGALGAWATHARRRRKNTLLDSFLSAHKLDDYVAWYYTPMALQFTAHLRAAATVYDCMDELSAFAGV